MASGDRGERERDGEIRREIEEEQIKPLEEGRDKRKEENREKLKGEKGIKQARIKDRDVQKAARV